MRKQKNKRGKNPRATRQQVIIEAPFKKNGNPNPKAGQKTIINHANIVFDKPVLEEVEAEVEV